MKPFFAEAVVPFDHWTVHKVWGRPRKAPDKYRAAVLHHSVTNLTGKGLDDVRHVEDIIRRRKKFSMIAYNFLVVESGAIYVGRGFEQENGANKG